MLHYRHIDMLTMSTSHVGVHGKAGHGRRSTVEKRTTDNFTDNFIGDHYQQFDSVQSSNGGGQALAFR